jgi:hypothetical protein
MIRILISTIIFVLLSSCGDENLPQNLDEKDSSVEMIYTFPQDKYKKIIDSLSVKALLEGDTLAYRGLSFIYTMVKLKQNELFYYAYRMAMKHNYSMAYWDLYYILSSSSNNLENFDDMDECTKKLALFYLLNAYERGDSNAKYRVIRIFKKGKIPNSKVYLDYFCN